MRCGFSFFGISMLAVLVGNLPWIISIAPPRTITYLYSPVFVIVYLLELHGDLACLGIVALAVGLIAIGAIVFHRRKYRWLFPTGLLIISFIHGPVAMWIISGLIT